MNGLAEIFKKRMYLSRVLGAVGVVAYVFMAPVWSDRHVGLAAGFAFTGLLLVSLGVVGRVWALSYLVGKKSKSLVTEGPFSLCRNPLYLFSFLGMLGLCLRTRTLVIPAVVMPVFMLVHLRSVRHEEGKLRAMFPAEFDAYAKTIPRFIPSFAHFKESDMLSVNAVLFRKGITELTMFFVILAFFELVTVLHQTGMVPVLFRIY
jgi:protein-S-isoprenylcysteine O-methyltransferase Ste14